MVFQPVIDTESSVDLVRFRLQEANTVGMVTQSGAYLSEMMVGEEHVLFPLDREHPVSEEVTKTRGGMPVCFPNFGPDSYGALPPHGFARDARWTTRTMDEDGGVTTVVLDLGQNDETPESFPWPFEAKMTYAVKPGSVLATLRTENLSDVPFSISPGFHPYFSAPRELMGKQSIIIDNLAGFDSQSFSWDTAVVVHGNPQVIKLRIPNARPIQMTMFGIKNVVVWSEPEQPYICVEPCIGLIRGEDAKILMPGEQHTIGLEIKVF